MLKSLQNKKQELRKKSDDLEKSLREELTGTFKDTPAFFKAGLIGTGLLLTTYVTRKLIKLARDNENNGMQKTEEGEAGTGTAYDSVIRSEFRDKLVIIVLEMLRQLLIMIIDKLRPADERPDLR